MWKTSIWQKRNKWSEKRFVEILNDKTSAIAMIYLSTFRVSDYRFLYSNQVTDGWMCCVL